MFLSVFAFSFTSKVCLLSIFKLAKMNRLENLKRHLSGNASKSVCQVEASDCSQGTPAIRTANSKQIVGNVSESTLAAYKKWHEGLEAGFSGKTDQLLSIFDELFSDDVVFRAPTYWSDKAGKEYVSFALMGVAQVFKDFEYTREIVSVS